jgi:hypothetical protein
MYVCMYVCVCAAVRMAQYLVGADAKYQLATMIMLPSRVIEALVEAMYLKNLVPACRRVAKVLRIAEQ